ncbi:MAG: hypothetical protein MJ169_01280 [Treponema sp.]|nr:hypothetical protein [Treponema sp.]
MAKKKFAFYIEEFTHFKKILLSLIFALVTAGSLEAVHYRPRHSFNDFIWDSDTEWKYKNIVGTWGGAGNYPGAHSDDVVYIQGEADITITANSDILIDKIQFNDNDGSDPKKSFTTTLDLTGHTFNIQTTYLGNDSATTGHVVIKNGTYNNSTLLEFSEHSTQAAPNTLTLIDSTLVLSGSFSVTDGYLVIDGNGTLDMRNATFNIKPGSSMDHIIVSESVNLISTDNGAITVTKGSDFTVASPMKFTITYAIAPASDVIFTYKYTVTDTNNNYTFDGTPLSAPSGTGTITFPAGATSADFDIVTDGSGFVPDGKGFTVTVKHPAEPLTQATGSFAREIKPVNWVGTTSDWYTFSNWQGITNIHDLENAQNINIYNIASAAPVIPAVPATVSYPDANILVQDGISLTSNAKLEVNSITTGATSDVSLLTGSSITGDFITGNGTGTITLKGDHQITGAFKPLCNLVLGDGTDTTLDCSILETVNHDITISGKTTITYPGALTLNGPVILSAELSVDNNNGQLKFARNLEVADNAKITTDNSPVSINTVSSAAAKNLEIEISNPTAANSKVEFHDTLASDAAPAGNITVTAMQTSLKEVYCKDLTVNGNTLVLNNIKSETATFDGTLTVKSDSQIEATTGTITVTGLATLGADATFKTTDQDITLTGIATAAADTNSITFDAGSANIILSGGIGTSAKPVADITITSGTLSVQTDVYCNNWNNNGTLSQAAASTAYISGNVNGSSDFNAVVINGTGTTAFDSENTFVDFTCTTSGKTLVFPAAKTQTVTGTFTVKDITIKSDSAASSGTADQWILDLPAGQGSAVNVDVTNSKATTRILCTGTCTSGGNNINWNMATKYTWLGGYDAGLGYGSWDNPDNWSAANGNTTSYPGESEGDEVVIESTVPGGVWPVIIHVPGTQLLPLKSISVGTGAQLIYAARYDIKVSAADKFTNAGKITYTTANRFVNNPASPAVPQPINDASNGGTIELKDSAVTLTDFSQGYANLIINTGVTSVSGDISVKGTLEVPSTASITESAPGHKIAVNGTSSINGNITCGELSFGGAVELGADLKTLTAGKGVSFGTNNLKLTADSSITTNSGTITANTITTDNASAISFDTTDKLITINAAAGTSVKPLGNITATGSAIAFKAAVYADTISVTGNANLYSSITASGTVSVSGNTTLYGASTITTSSKAITLGSTAANTVSSNTDEAYSLTLNSGTSTVTVNGTAGPAGKALNAVTITASSAHITGNVKCKNINWNKLLIVDGTTTATANPTPSPAIGNYGNDVTAVFGDNVSATAGSISILGGIKAGKNVTSQSYINIGTNAVASYPAHFTTGQNTIGQDITGTIITFSGATTCSGKIKGTATNAPSKFNATVTVNGTGEVISAYGIDISSSGSIICTAGKSQKINLTNNWKNEHGTAGFTAADSTVTIGKNITGSTIFHKAVINGTGTSQITSDNTFDTFECKAAKTLEFTAGTTQTVDTLFDVENATIKSSSASHAAAADQWILTSAASPVYKAKNVNVQNSNSTIEFVTCTGACVYSGNNINWDMSTDFTWKADAANQNWNDSANWTTASGSTGIWPGMNSNDSALILNSVRYPKFALTQNIILDNLTIGADTTDDRKATLNMNSTNSIRVKTDLKNFGRINLYNDSGRITDNAATPALINDDANRGYVRYNTGTTAISDMPYANLEIYSAVTTIENDITTVRGLTVSTTGSITSADSHSITVGTTSAINGNITNNGNLVFNQGVTLAANVTTTGTATQWYKSTLKVTKDNLSISSANSNITIAGNITSENSTSGGPAVTHNLTINAGTAKLTTTRNLGVAPDTIFGNVSITAGTYNAGADINCKELTINGTTAAITGSVTASTGDITINGTTAAIGGNLTATAGTLNLSSNTTVDGIIKAGTDININKNTTVKGTGSALSCKNLTIDSTDGKLTAYTAAQEFNVTGNWDNQRGTAGFVYTTSHTLNLGGNLKGQNTLYDANIAGNIESTNTFNKLTVTAKTPSVANDTTQVSASNTMSEFECTATGKTLIFNAGTTQTVNTSFNVENVTVKSDKTTHADTVDQWTLTGTGTPSYTATNVKVQNSSSTVEFVACDAACTDNGNNKNWAIAADYVWTGRVSDDWQDADNWLINDSKSYSWPGRMHTGDTATITYAKKQNNWPVYSGSTAAGKTPVTGTPWLEIVSLTITSSASSTAQLTLADQKISVSKISNPFVNNGLLIYTTDTGFVTNYNADTTRRVPINDTSDTSKGTIRFTDSATKVLSIYPAANDYYNLELDSNLKLTNNTTVKNNVTLTAGKTLSSETAAGSAYSLTVKNDAALNGTVNGIKNLTVNGNATSTGAIAVTATGDIAVGKNTTAVTTLTLSSPSKITLGTTLATDAVTATDTSITAPVTKITGKLTGENTAITSSTSTTLDTTSVNTTKLDIVNGKLFVTQNCTISCTSGFTHSGTGTDEEFGSAAAQTVTINTTDSAISLGQAGTTNLKGNLVLTTGTGDGDILLNQNITGTTDKAQKLTLTAGTGNITLDVNIGTQALNLGSIKINSVKNFTVNSNKSVYAADFDLTSSDLFLTKKDSLISAAAGFAKKGPGKSQLASTIQTVNSAISFASDTYIYDESELNAGTANITVTCNNSTDGVGFVISAFNSTPQPVAVTARSFSVNGTGAAKNNFVLFNGNVTFAANLATTGDIILLNGNSPAMYKINNSTVAGSKTSGLSYLNTLRTTDSKLCSPSLASYPAKHPDNLTAISDTSYKSSFTGFEGKTITAGQNFYDNGVDLDASSSWNLNLKNNADATVSFAELHNAQISNCTAAGGYLAAGENCTDNSGNNDHVAFTHPVILFDRGRGDTSEGDVTPETPNFSGTYTVRDNIIRIEFVRNTCDQTAPVPGDSLKIENTNNEISRAVLRLSYNNTSGSPVNFEGAYINAECTVSTDGQGDLAVFYLKAPDSARWNLDASGTEIGEEDDSLGNHQSRKNDIRIERALSDLFATLYDEHKNRICNYSANPITTPSSQENYLYTATTSRCATGHMYITTSLAQSGSNKIYIFFDHPVNKNEITWKGEGPLGSGFHTLDAFKFFDNPSNPTPLAIRAVDVDLDSLNEYGIIIELDTTLSFKQITSLGYKIVYDSSMLYKNRIHSTDRKVVYNNESHCITDYALNMINVQYAYDGRNEVYNQSMTLTPETDSIAVHDFSGGTKANRVFEDKDVHLVAKNIYTPYDPANDPAATAIDYKLIADISPSANCRPKNYNELVKRSSRTWVPSPYFVPRTNDSPNMSTNIVRSDLNPDLIEPSVDEDTLRYLFHNFSENTPCLNWKTGSEVEFIFEVMNNNTPYSINHSFKPGAPETPLYAMRLDNPADLSTFDLWSFRIKEPQRQRGGVSIYNNVINVSNGDFCTLEVNMPRAGNLRAIIMTADGNIVKYLESGRTTEGLHYYYWHGKNKTETPVARGIYFIRIVGPDIDETRKVMVVK